MSERRPYRRPMNPRWWAYPPYRAYTLRELSGVAVMLYGVILFFGVVCLAIGPGAWEAYVGFLRTPFSIILHLLLLAAVIFHVVTWFQTLPKTMPKLIVKGKQVPPQQITQMATRVALGCSLVVVIITVLVAR